MTVGIISAVLTVVGIGVAYLQLRRTPQGKTGPAPPVTPVSLVLGDIPRQPLAHVEREDLLLRLTQALEQEKLSVLVGRKGSGKTHLAATHVRGRLGGGIGRVIWIVAEDAAAIVTALAATALRCGIVDEIADTVPAARHALRWLEQQPDPTLLVLDNATDPDAILGWLPTTGNVEVIVTTTNQDFIVFGGVVPVGPFEPAQAAAFLSARASNDDVARAGEVALRLENLPLALAQAGAVIRRRRLSFAQYLKEFESVPLATSLPRVPGENYPSSLEDATLLSIAGVENGDAGGVVRRLLLMVATLSEAGVGRHILHRLPDGPLDVDHALAELASASIIGFDLEGATVLMHRLTRKVVVERARRQGQDRAAVAEAVDLLTRVREAGIDVVDHIDEVWRAGLGDSSVFAALVELRLWSINRLVDVNELDRAVQIAGRTLTDLQAATSTGDDHLEHARQAFRRVSVLADRYLEAIPFVEEDLAECLRKAGPDSSTTIAARNSLGYLCECGGLLDRAIEIHALNLAESLRVCGPDARSTMAARINMASTYRSMGRMADAVPIFEENLAENIRVHGPGDPSSVNARGELARAYVRSGRAEEGLRLHEENRVFIENAPSVDWDEFWWSQYRATAYSVAGQHDEAISQLRALAARAGETLTERNPRAIRMRLSLARALITAGKTAEAVRLFERTVDDRSKVLGPDHTASLNARRNLGLAVAVSGRTRRASAILRAVLDDYVRVLGPDHPYTRTARSTLARVREVRAFPV
ncbi:tetratricopeptide repeat protein [Actinoplanes lutulentus]|uniref:Tetratricopeptide repeat protein n=1 Tax=Actinoplanes lutulentus TaxID=1287878 RepID=A0A327Z2X4_9ACTN|nr:tetratricopeptide repeat protein [Actinoplanes lutulentus]